LLDKDYLSLAEVQVMGVVNLPPSALFILSVGCASIGEFTISVTSPAISNGLSFNTNTGAISGVPIVASDPVTYVITATSFFTYNEDTATVVIAEFS
jgi:hypothetical protein